MRLFTGGAGESLGSWLATSSPLYISGNVWYVHATTGTDAASPSGQDRSKPLATIAQAVTNAADHDIIVLLDGHTQTITAVQSLAKKLMIVGGGQSSDGKPTVKLTLNAAAASLFTASVTDVMLANIWFNANAQTNASPKVHVTGGGFRMEGCYFECGATDTGAALRVDVAASAGGVRVVNTTFVSTATVTSAQPESAIKSVSTADRLEFEGLVLDNGTVGFSNFYAMDLSAGAVTRIVAKQISLLRGADVKMHASSVGVINPSTTSGGPRVEW